MRGIFSTVVLLVQLYGALGNLPTLPGNRLLTGDATKLPGSSLIDCMQGPLILSDFKRKKTLKPSEVLVGSEFKNHAFTAHAVVPRGLGTFSFAKMTHGFLQTRTTYALQEDSSSDAQLGYWLPQGGSVDVPRVPGPGDPKYVFTADYSGCSWTVTPMNNGYLRLRHVEGGHENVQFNLLYESAKGGPVTYAMQYKDYGYIHKHGRLIEHATAFAYMHFSNGRWMLHVQHQTCAPRPGNFVYKDGHIDTLKQNYFNQNRYSAISGTEFWSIP